MIFSFTWNVSRDLDVAVFAVVRRRGRSEGWFWQSRTGGVVPSLSPSILPFVAALNSVLRL